MLAPYSYKFFLTCRREKIQNFITACRHPIVFTHNLKLSELITDSAPHQAPMPPSGWSRVPCQVSPLHSHTDCGHYQAQHRLQILIVIHPACKKRQLDIVQSDFHMIIFIQKYSQGIAKCGVSLMNLAKWSIFISVSRPVGINSPSTLSYESVSSANLRWGFQGATIGKQYWSSEIERCLRD